MAGIEGIINDDGIPVCGHEKVDLTAADASVNRYVCPMFKLSEEGLPLCRKQGGRACLLNNGEIVIFPPQKELA